MKTVKKTGILLVLLAVPVFIWLFLDRFGKNEYEVPVYYAQGIGQTGCDTGQGVHTLPAFRLQQAGRQQHFTDKDLNDKLSVVYLFGYPCDTACGSVMESLARVQNVFEKEDRVQILAVDTTSSSPELLNSLSQTYQSRAERWKFLSAEKEQLETLLRCGFVLSLQEDVQHPLVLIDGQKRIRGYYAGTDTEEIDRLVLEIRILLYMLNQEQ